MTRNTRTIICHNVIMSKSDSANWLVLNNPHKYCYSWPTKGAFFWDYSGYSYSGLGTEYTEFRFAKERLFILKTEYSRRRWPENYVLFQPEARRPARGERGRPHRISRQFPKRTRILRIPSKPYSVHSVHSKKRIAPKRTRHYYRLFRGILFQNSPRRKRLKSKYSTVESRGWTSANGHIP